MASPPSGMVRNALTQEQVVDVLRQWWREGPKARDLDEAGSVTASSLLYAPFWSTTWEVTACVAVPLPLAPMISPVHCVVPRVIAWTDIACPVDAVGVRFLPRLAGEVLPPGRCPGPEIPVSVDEGDVLPGQKKAVERRAFTMLVEQGPHYPSEELRTVLLESALVSYPLWVVHYSYGDRSYQATIDGVTGEVLAGTAPGDLRARRRAGASALLVCAVAVALSLCLLLIFPLIFAVYYIVIIGIVCFIIVDWYLRFVRYGSVLVSGQAEGGYRYDEGPPSPLRPAPP
ncbi:MAG: hypothetical protein PHP59_07960 [Methanofollis sp.]|uniref:hypothetical protein n=1 Tax=Methanofollis sp. TaxID=2052835 RepID=UPI00260CF89E|nr:hypothetical protein [Methanofollis sp.]MDD4255294.1 hypothetical protein [Methanofollis sp.]